MFNEKELIKQLSKFELNLENPESIDTTSQYGGDIPRLEADIRSELLKAYQLYFKKSLQNKTSSPYLPSAQDIVYGEIEEFEDIIVLAEIYTILKLESELGNSAKKKFGIDGENTTQNLQNILYELGIEEDIRVYYLNTFFLDTGMCVGVDTTQGTTNTALYTTNASLVYTIDKNGVIEDNTKTGVPKKLEQLNKKFEKGLTKKDMEFSYGLGRLDVVSVNQTKEETELKYSFVLPSFIPMYTEEYRFYPFFLFPILAKAIVDFSKDMPIKVYQEKNGILKERVFTSSAEIEREIYKKEDKSLVEGLIKNIKLGLDLPSLTIRLFNLEASINSMGYSRLDIFDLVGIERIDIKDIDISGHRKDFGILMVIADKKLSDAKKEDILPLIDEKAVNSKGEYLADMEKEDIVKHILKGYSTLESDTLYDYMTKYPNIFGNVDKLLEFKEQREKQMFVGFKEVEIPEDEMERYNLLSDLLNKGMVRFRSSSSKNTGSKLYYATNNREILEKYYGKNYLENYGTDPERLKEFKKIGIGATDREIVEGVKKYRLEKYFTDSKSEIEIRKARAFLQEPIQSGYYYEIKGNDIEYKEYDISEKDYSKVVYNKLALTKQGDTTFRTVKTENIKSLEFSDSVK